MQLIAPKPLLVGEANPYSLDPDMALFPWPRQAAGNRLREILGLTDAKYVKRFDRINLVRGHRWSIKLAREEANRLLAERGGPMVLLGAKVASAFGLDFTPFTVARGQLYLLPHPSGLCRVWNDSTAVPRTRSLLGEFLTPELRP